jgi:homoserine kinase
MSHLVSHPVRVSVPATSANLGPGFDSVAIAWHRYDDVTARLTSGAGSVAVDGEGASQLPLDETNLVMRALRHTLDHVSVPQPPIALRCRNRIPQGRGLGSSAAAIVAGIRAAEGLLAADLGPDLRLLLATGIEGHPDNVAACLSGGVTLSWTDADRVRALRLVPHPALVGTVFVPPDGQSTHAARGLLPKDVPHEDAAFNAGRAALLSAALTQFPELLPEATEDRLHQRYRALAMPASYALVRSLRSAGLAAVTSGAGPTVLVLHERNTEVAEPAPAGWRRETMEPDRDGAVVTTGE